MPELLQASKIELQIDLEDSGLSRRLRDKCSRLIRLGASGEVELLHYSLRECLLERYNRSDGHVMLAVICLKYLCSEDFKRIPICILGVDYTKQIRESLTKDFPLLEYASAFVGYHLKESADRIEIALPQLDLFLNTESLFFRTWDYVSDWLSRVTRDISDRPTPILHVLSYWNAVSLISRVDLHQDLAVYGLSQQCRETSTRFLDLWKSSKRLRINQNCAAADKAGLTMLHRACHKGHIEFVRFHVVHCPYVNMENELGTQPIHLAVSHVAVLDLLISAGAHVDVADSHGVTPLMIAVARDAYESAELLLLNGAKADLQSKDETPVLVYAIEQDSARMIKLLLRFGAKVDQPDGTGLPPISRAVREQSKGAFCALVDHVTLGPNNKALSIEVLHEAVSIGEADYVEILLDKGIEPDTVLLDEDFQWTGLLLALEWEFPNVAKVFLLKGASRNLKKRDGTTPLHTAAEAGYLEVCELMIDLGVDVDAVNDDKKTPLLAATWARREAVVDLLIRNHADSTVQDHLKVASPLHAAAGIGLKAAVKSILSSQSRPDMDSLFGYDTTPFGLAIIYGSYEIVELLIEEGADIDKLNSKQQSPLLIAVQKNRVEAVKSLLQHNAKLHTPDADWTILHASAVEDNIEITRMLLEKWDPTDVDCRTEHGRTALWHACRQGRYEVVRALLSHRAQATLPMRHFSIFSASCLGGDIKTFFHIKVLTGSSIDELDADDWTPLMCACFGGHTRLIKYLLSHGADISRRDKFEQQPLHKAINSSHSNKAEVVKILLDHSESLGHDVALATVNSAHQGRTSIFDACVEGDLEIVSLLLKRQADPMPQSEDLDWSPLSVSCFKGHQKIVTVLLDHPQVDPLDLDMKRRNCLHLSLSLFLREMVTLIISKLLISKDDVLDRMLAQKDFFGRTPFDYVTIDFLQPESDIPGGNSSSSKHHRSISQLVLDMKQGYEHRDIRFSDLGKELIFAGDEENSVFAYQRRIDWACYEGEKVLEQAAMCNSCRTDSNITSSRYVCRKCSDIDLCELCHEKYTKGQYSKRTCKSHKFLCVPIPTFSEEEREKRATVLDRDQIDAWLARLEERYLVVGGAMSRQGTGFSQEVNDIGVNLELLAYFRRLGCLGFRKPLLLTATGPVVFPRDFAPLVADGAVLPFESITVDSEANVIRRLSPGEKTEMPEEDDLD